MVKLMRNMRAMTKVLRLAHLFRRRKKTIYPDALSNHVLRDLGIQRDDIKRLRSRR